MRDRENTQIKPPNTYRIVLIGGSHDQGSAVKDNETYENLVEDRLNAKAPDQHYSRYEILNLSQGGTGILQRLLRFEQQGFQFAPDFGLFSIAAHDPEFLVEHLRKVVTLGVKPPADYREIFERTVGKAHIHGKMPDAMI